MLASLRKRRKEKKNKDSPSSLKYSQVSKERYVSLRSNVELGPHTYPLHYISTHMHILI
jgi:hypothetical protein